MKLHLLIAVMLMMMLSSQMIEASLSTTQSSSITLNSISLLDSNSSSDSGVNVNFEFDCMDLSSTCVPGLGCIGKICLGFVLDSCKQSVYFNFTRNDDVLLAFNVTSLQTQKICRAQGPCQNCISFSQVSFTPAGVTLCPRVSLECPFGVRPSTDFKCVSLGTECQAKNCTSCANMTNCGWCEGDKTCKPIGQTGPYCTSCTPSKSWFTSAPMCPDYIDPSSRSKRSAVVLNGGEIAGIVIACVVSLGLIAWLVVVIVKRRKLIALEKHTKMPMESRGGSADVEDSQTSQQPLALAAADADGVEYTYMAPQPVNATNSNPNP